MRVIIAHNYYGSESPSGENIAFEDEVKLLRSRGHLVETFTRSNDQILNQGFSGKIVGGMSTLWSFSAIRELRKMVNQFRPDIFHAHNTFPLISNAVFCTSKIRCARVLTLHNYRIFCAAGAPLRDKQICTECLDKESVFPALKHSCYRQSLIATAPLAGSIALHRHLGTWTNKVDGFIALSEFQKSKVVSAGLPEDKVSVVANYVSVSGDCHPWSEREPYAVVVGRLSREKGIFTLCQAWKRWGSDAPELRIIGDGPERSGLERLIEGTQMRLLGRLPREEVMRHISKAKLLIFPSEALETFGLTVVEAMSVGTPVAVSDVGSLPTIIRNGRCGLVFRVGDPESILETIRAAWLDKFLLKQLGASGYREFHCKYTEETHYESLLNVYNQAIDRFRGNLKKNNLQG